MLNKFKKKGTLYKVMGLSIALLFVFFLSSRFLISGPQNYKNTPLREQITSGTLTEEMTSKTFYKDKNILAVGLIINQDYNTSLAELKAKVVEKTDLKAKYKTSLVPVMAQYYMLFVQSLPHHWRDVSIRISEKGVESNGFTKPEKIYVSRKSAIEKAHFVERNTAYYKRQYLDILITDSQKMIKKEASNRKEFQQKIKHLQSNIKSLNEELSYQVGQDKVDLKNEIRDKNNEINSTKKEIAKSKDATKTQKKKIQLLKEKQEELQPKIQKS